MKLRYISLALLFVGFSSLAQNNPAFYFSVTQCDNIEGKIILHEKTVIIGSCDSLKGRVIYINPFLEQKGNKLNFSLENHRRNDLHGLLAYEILVEDQSKAMVKTVFAEILELKDGNNFVTPIDFVLKRNKWNPENKNPELALAEKSLLDLKDQPVKHSATSKPQFILFVTSSENAEYTLFVNDSTLLTRSRENRYDPVESIPISLNNVNRSQKQVFITCVLKAGLDNFESVIQIQLVYIPAHSANREVLYEATINQSGSEPKSSRIELTNQLRRKGFF